MSGMSKCAYGSPLMAGADNHHLLMSTFFFPPPFLLACKGGQLFSDGRIGATDSIARVHTRQPSRDPQHLLLFHQLCWRSVSHICSGRSTVPSNPFCSIWRVKKKSKHECALAVSEHWPVEIYCYCLWLSIITDNLQFRGNLMLSLSVIWYKSECSFIVTVDLIDADVYVDECRIVGAIAL